MMTLESIREGDSLRISLIRPGDSISSYGVMHIPIRQLADYCGRMVETLNRTTRKGIGYSEALVQLKDLGTLLCNDLLTSEIKESLLHTDEIHLSVRTDDRLVHIPWELICLDDEFLCCRFAMGRNVQTRQTIRRRVQRQISYPMQMWVVANPQGDLDKALEEGMEICDGMDRLNIPELRINAFLGSEVCLPDVQKKIRNYDMLHFAGHADYDDRHPEQSGWKLKDSLLRASDLKKMEGGAAMPLLVFSNACQSARTGEWGSPETGADNAEDRSFGLVNAFMMSGVRHYIGTAWEIRDESGSYFALEFYRHLLAGNTIGQALRLSRQVMSEKGQDAGWAAYVLYGDPCVSYFGQSEAENLLCREEKSAPVPEYIIHNKASLPAENFAKGIRSGKSDAARDGQPDILKSVKNLTGRRGFLLGSMLAILMFFLLILLFPPFPEFFSPERPPVSSYAKESVPEPVYEDEWTSRPLQMTVMYDADSLHSDLEDMIAAAVEMKVAAEYPRIPLVDRQYLAEMLAEHELNRSDHIDPAKKLSPGKILPASFRLRVKVSRSKAGASVQMRLIDNESGQYLDVYSKNFQPEERIADQKDELAGELLETLQELYPLQGTVTERCEQSFRLNIGTEVGVRPGQRFRVADAGTDKEVVLKIISAKRSSSAALPEHTDIAPDVAINKGTRVVAVQ